MPESPRDLNKKNKGRIFHFDPPLIDLNTEVPLPVEAEQEMDDPKAEALRVVKRLTAIVEDHRQAAIPLKIELGAEDLSLVIAALREHAKGGAGTPVAGSRDEIHAYCLDRLFDELVEEPSNILFTTQKGADTIRYDAMSAPFWLKCLDLLEEQYAARDT